MKIVIDCFKQVKGVGKSVGIYNLTLNLVKNLIEYRRKTNNIDIKNAELVIIGNRYNEEDFKFPEVKFIQIKNYNPLNKVHCVIWELLVVSLVCKKMKADRVIFPRGFSALTNPVKDIIIIHDMIPFYYDEHFPNAFNKIENTYVMHRLKASAKFCDRVITISEASKQDVLKYCDINEKKITVIHNGCNEVPFNIEKTPQEKPYICAITSDLPHKNALGVLKSYQKYCELSEKPLDLKVIGIADTARVEFTEEVEKKITCYKYIKENIELYRIVANSSVFLFLSLSEGFGFPPIEAMQLNVPVVCSKLSSLPEVVGDAALLVDPENPEAVAKTLDELIIDSEKQEMLIDKGKENVRRFSWDSKAELYWKAVMS